MAGPGHRVPGRRDRRGRLVGERVGHGEPADLAAAVRPRRPAGVGRLGRGAARGGPRRRRADAGDARPDGRPRVRQPARRRLGQLAAEVLTSTDVGVPVGPSGTIALLPENIEKFTAGLDRPASEVMIYLAAREAAHQRLFAHVGWLRERLLGTVEEYARGHHGRHVAIEEMAGASTRPTRGPSRRPCARGCSSSRPPRRSRPRCPAGDAARADRGLGRRRRRGRRRRPAARGRRAAGDAAPAPRLRRAGRADVRDDRRAGAAAAAAAQRRRAVAAAGRAARDRGPRRAVGAPGPDPVGRGPGGPRRLRRARGDGRPDRGAGEGVPRLGRGRRGGLGAARVVGILGVLGVVGVRGALGILGVCGRLRRRARSGCGTGRPGPDDRGPDDGGPEGTATA